MSAGMASNTKLIYMPLLDEGTQVMRPTQGVLLADKIFQVLATPDYDPDDEHWQFPPGSIVRCVEKVENGETLFVAEAFSSKP